MKKYILGVITLLILNACSNTQNIEPPKGTIQEIPKQESMYPTKVKQNDLIKNKKLYALLKEGKIMLFKRKPNEAIENYFNVVIKQQEKVGINDKILYAQALHHKGYAYIDLNMLKKAEENIQKAITISDNKAPYIAELAFIYQKKRNWIKAYKLFLKAEKYAKKYPEEYLVIGRALRGKGFVLTEMKQYKKAIKEYKKALNVNNNDIKAMHELNYLASLGYK